MTSERPSRSLVSTVSMTSDDPSVYQLIKRNDINLVEVEDANARAVEVSVLWQVAILHVAHLDATQGFSLSSEALKGDDTTHFVVDSAMIGGLPAARIITQEAGETRFVFLAGCKGEVEIRGEKRSLEDLIAQGHATPSTEIAGAYETAVVSGGRYRMEVGGLTVVAKVVARGRRFAQPVKPDRGLLGSALGALVAIGSLMGVSYFAAGDDAAMVSADDSENRIAELRDFMARQRERQPEETPAQEAAAVNHGETGQAHAGASGTMGDRQSAQRNHRYEIQRRDPMPHTGQPAREQVQHRGIFAALGQSPAASEGAMHASPFSAMLTASGEGERDLNGNMNGELAGESWGNGGLGPSGTGIGGGGDGHDTIGTGRVGTQGRGNCLPGQDCSYGSAAGHPHADRGTHGPTVTPSRPEVSGMIAPDVIRRVVLRNIGQVNRCYEQGLNTNPELAGRVAVRFVIAGGGNVLTARVADSSLNNAGVSECIAGAVQRWNFPVPTESPAITVTYPFSLMPAEL